MRDLTTIQLDEIKNGGWAKVETFEQAERLMKAINRKEIGTTKRAIARRAIHPDTGWLVAYGDLRDRSQLLSVAQKIRRDHVADAAGLGLDALIGLLYSTSLPWLDTSYSDRMDQWTEHLHYTAPEVANDRDKYLMAWETVEPLIRESVPRPDESPTVVLGKTASTPGPHAAQNEGIARVRELHRLYPLVKPWAKLILAGHGLVEVVSYPFLSEQPGEDGHLVNVRMTPGDPTSMKSVVCGNLLPRDHAHKLSDVIESAMDAAEENMVRLIGQLAGSLLPWSPGVGPVEGTVENAKLQDFIGEFANQLTEDARVTFLGYVNAAATAAQLEREDALPDITGVGEDDFLPGGCQS